MISKLFQYSGFKKYATNTSWLMVEKFFRLFVSFIVGAWVARYLGPAKFGSLSFSVSLVMLFSAVSSLGLESVITKELVSKPEKSTSILGSSLLIKLLGTLIMIIFIITALEFSDISKQTKLLIYIIASSYFFKAFDVIDFYFQSRVISKYVVYSNSIAFTISSLVKISLILNTAELIYFAYIYLLEAIVVFISFLFFYQKVSGNGIIGVWKIKYSTIINLLKDSWPLFLSTLTITLYMRLDQVMIQSMINSEALGVYSVAVRLSEVWYFIPVVVCSSVFPAIVNFKLNNNLKYLESLQILYSLMIWIALCGYIIVLFGSEFVIEKLFGTAYLKSATILKIHFLSGVFVAFGVARGKWILTEGLQKYTLVYTVCGAVSNCIFNFFLIPTYGVLGAAYATLIAQFVSAYLIPLIIPQTRLSCYMFNKAVFPIKLIKHYVNRTI
jgi:O-antigen/teichoic acid export membrane protein